MKIYISTDDMRPSMISLWESTWDKLKEKHSSLKVTCFVPAHFREFGECTGYHHFECSNCEDVNDFKFKNWYKKRKRWVEVIPHGYYHKKPFENTRSLHIQKFTIKKSLTALKYFIKDRDCIGWKAPFYLYNQNMIKALIDCGVKWYEQWWQIFPLVKTNRPLNIPITLGTHTSSEQQNNPDNIGKIYDSLDKQLIELASKNIKEYTTATEIVKGAIE